MAPPDAGAVLLPLLLQISGFSRRMHAANIIDLYGGP